MAAEHLWKPDLEDGTYKNPVLYADYSDPDVVRAGDTYYMTASSFNYVPGLPILTSKDLVNWTLVNYALTQINDKKYDMPQYAKGVWAPAIRYHGGRFYIYYGIPDDGIFMVSTEDALGKWDEPVLVLGGKGLIDPCPFRDEDGKAYVVHGYAKSRIGFKSCLGIFPMSPDGKKAIGEDHILFDGAKTQPTIEGPKVYKRNGYYYILAPAGGVKTGWQTALRSGNIYGPYEEKIVMRQGSTIVNGPHQGALVDTIHGDEWFLHFQDKGLYGRVVHMQPVVWENGWPVIGVDAQNGCGEPCLAHKKPDTGIAGEVSSLEASDDFMGRELKLLWQWAGNPKENFYSLTDREGFLRLFARNPSGKKESVLWENANVLTQKLVCPYLRADVCLHFGGLAEGEQAGVVMMGGYYAYLAVRNIAGKKTLVYAEAYEGEDGSVKEKAVPLKKLDSGGEKIVISFTLEKDIDTPVFRMYYAEKDGKAVNVPTEFMPSGHAWVGAKIGLFANVLDSIEKGGYADFEYIHVKNLE